MIGGIGKLVVIDESKFERRKYHHGHRVDGQWIFGGIAWESDQYFLIPIDSLDKLTLLKVIKDWFLPSITIISNCWEVYLIKFKIK